MSKEIKWEFDGKNFKVGEALNEYPWECNNIFPIVWFEKKLYKAIKKQDRICLFDIYNENKTPYWTTIDKVFNIIELIK